MCAGSAPLSVFAAGISCFYTCSILSSCEQVDVLNLTLDHGPHKAPDILSGCSWCASASPSFLASETHSSGARDRCIVLCFTHHLALGSFLRWRTAGRLSAVTSPGARRHADNKKPSIVVESCERSPHKALLDRSLRFWDSSCELCFLLAADLVCPKSAFGCKDCHPGAKHPDRGGH